MYKFLNDNDIDFNLINDIDMDQGESLNYDYKMIIIHAHPEYWTENALINLNKMIQREQILHILVVMVFIGELLIKIIKWKFVKMVKNIHMIVRRFMERFAIR